MASVAQDPDVTELGPVVLQKPAAPANARVQFVLGLIVIAIGLGFLVGAWLWGNQESLSGLLGCAGLFGFLGALLAGRTGYFLWITRGRTQYAHAIGLREASARESTVIRYAEASSVLYRVTEHYHNGMYAGTIYRFGLRQAGVPPREIVYEQLLRQPGERSPLQPLVNRAAVPLADRIEERIQRGEVVPWVSGILLDGDGLTFPPRPWSKRPGLAKFRAEAVTRVGWDDIADLDLKHGVCRLVLRDSQRPRQVVDSGEWDFYPGYFVITRIIRRRTAAQPHAPVRLEQGERITLEFPLSYEARLGLVRAAHRLSPKERSDTRQVRWILLLLPPICIAAIAAIAYSEGKLTLSDLITRIAIGVAIGVGGLIAYVLWHEWSYRREARDQQRRALEASGTSAGHAGEVFHRVELRLSGLAVRTPEGVAEYPWTRISRVVAERGGIVIIQAGDAATPERAAAFLPAEAFNNADHAQYVRDQITAWHEARHAAGPPTT